MPRHGGPMGGFEKSKDFKGTILRLFKSLNKWRAVLIVAMVLAFSSAILSTIAPNKLSNLTDVITDGIKPNTEKLKDVSQTIYSNAIKNFVLKNTKYYVGQTNAVDDFNLLSLEDKKNYLEDVEIDGNIVSVDDQVKFFEIISELNEDMVTQDMLSKLDELPDTIYNIVKPTMDLTKVKNFAILLSVIYITSALFGYVQSFLMSTVSNNYAKKLRNDISVKINKLPLNYFDKHETGDVLSRVTNDVDSVAQNMNNSLSSLISSVTLFIGSIIMMFVTNSLMALTAMVNNQL